jgi:hypothetical protein
MVTALALAALHCPPLFVVERSTNRNVVLYEARMRKDGTLDRKEPVRTRWKMVEKGPGVYEELTGFERDSAYGVETREAAADRATVGIKALSQRSIRIVKKPDACPHALVQMGDREIFLEKVFVKASGGLIPSVDRLTLRGRRVDTGEASEETLKP